MPVLLLPDVQSRQMPGAEGLLRLCASQATQRNHYVYDTIDSNSRQRIFVVILVITCSNTSK